MEESVLCSSGHCIFSDSLERKNRVLYDLNSSNSFYDHETFKLYILVLQNKGPVFMYSYCQGQNNEISSRFKLLSCG